MKGEENGPGPWVTTDERMEECPKCTAKTQSESREVGKEMPESAKRVGNSNDPIPISKCRWTKLLLQLTFKINTTMIVTNDSS